MCAFQVYCRRSQSSRAGLRPGALSQTCCCLLLRVRLAAKGLARAVRPSPGFASFCIVAGGFAPPLGRGWGTHTPSERLGLINSEWSSTPSSQPSTTEIRTIRALKTLRRFPTYGRNTAVPRGSALGLPSTPSAKLANLNWGAHPKLSGVPSFQVAHGAAALPASGLLRTRWKF